MSTTLALPNIWAPFQFFAGLLSYFKSNSLNSLLIAQFKEEVEGTLTITDNRTGSKYNVPVIRNSIPALSLRQISAGTKGKNARQQFEEGLRVLDPGYRNTAVKLSDITFIDGERGIILYRGRPIESLISKSYEDIAHLLIWGDLPTDEQRTKLRRDLAKACVAPPCVRKIIEAYPRDTPPVVMCMAGLTAFMAEQPNLIPSFVGKNLYNGKFEMVDQQIIRTLAVSAVVVSLTFCHQKGREFQEADPEASFIENLLRMGGFTDAQTTDVDPMKVEILQRLWVLYADHEMTNSTAAFLHVASSLADPVSATIACVASGYGPLHGGAIDTAYQAMRDVGSPRNVPNLISRVKNKEMRLFGYGHRIYKTVDPRSRFIREMLAGLTKGDLAANMDPVLAIAMEIDRIAGVDEYFTSRNLQANADLYGSFVYTALGVPVEFITPVTMLSRMPGIMAHWKEAMGRTPEIWRPQQIYTGPKPCGEGSS